MVPGQEHWTGPAPLSHLSHNLKLSQPLPGPLCTHLSSGDMPLPASHTETGSQELWHPCSPVDPGTDLQRDISYPW